MSVEQDLAYCRYQTVDAALGVVDDDYSEAVLTGPVGGTTAVLDFDDDEPDYLADDEQAPEALALPPQVANVMDQLFAGASRDVIQARTTSFIESYISNRFGTQAPAAPLAAGSGLSARLQAKLDEISGPITAKVEQYVDAVIDARRPAAAAVAAPVAHDAIRCNLSSIIRRAGLNCDESRELADHPTAMNSIAAYINDGKHYAAAGLSVGEFVQSEHSKVHGIWPASVAGALGTKLPEALETALAKCDEQVRYHFPRLSETGLLRY